MEQFMGFVDDVLHDMGGLLSYSDVIHMTYKEIGYLRAHHKKHYPPEQDNLLRALMGSPKNAKPRAAPRKR